MLALLLLEYFEKNQQHLKNLTELFLLMNTIRRFTAPFGRVVPFLIAFSFWSCVLFSNIFILFLFKIFMKII